MKTWLGAVACVVVGASSAGCAGLLGLDDKFEETGGGGTGTGTGTGGSGGTGGSTTTDTDSTGGGGAGGGPPLLPLNDELDFDPPTNKPQEVLVENGWLFTWQGAAAEQYPPPGPGAAMPEFLGTATDLLFGQHETFHWVDEHKGLLIYKKIQGDFLVITDVQVKDLGSPPAIPGDDQAGAGLMARDPASASAKEGGQRWVSIDRSGKAGTTYVHASYCDGALDGSSGPASTAGGKIALCRHGEEFKVWAKTQAGWEPMTAYIEAMPPGLGAVEELQVGLFVYAFNVGDAPSPKGVAGVFKYVHQYDPDPTCDPALTGE